MKVNYIFQSKLKVLKSNIDELEEFTIYKFDEISNAVLEVTSKIKQVAESTKDLSTFAKDLKCNLDKFRF